MDPQSNNTINILILMELKLFRQEVNDEIKSMKEEIVNLSDRITCLSLSNAVRPEDFKYEQDNFDEFSGSEMEYVGKSEMDPPSSFVANGDIKDSTGNFASEMNEHQSGDTLTNNEGNENMESALDFSSNSLSVSGQESNMPSSNFLPILYALKQQLGGGNAEQNMPGTSTSLNNKIRKAIFCRYCHKQFSTMSRLTQHIRTHTGEKPFTCTVCGQRFSQSWNLKAHMKYHNDDKPYQCMYCEKRFTQAAHLKDHITTHTGEKPFKCLQCGECFTRGSSLKYHIRLHTGEKPYKCKDCDQCFIRASYLKRHSKTHNTEQLPTLNQLQLPNLNPH